MGWSSRVPRNKCLYQGLGGCCNTTPIRAKVGVSAVGFVPRLGADQFRDRQPEGAEAEGGEEVITGLLYLCGMVYGGGLARYVCRRYGSRRGLLAVVLAVLVISCLVGVAVYGATLVASLVPGPAVLHWTVLVATACASLFAAVFGWWGAAMTDWGRPTSVGGLSKG